MILKRRPNTAFTLIEIVIGLVFFSMLAYFSYTLMSMTAGRSAAVSKKSETVSAVFLASGKLRRDIKWASEIDIQKNGRLIVLTGKDTTKRIWNFDAKTMELQLPSTSDPTKLAVFRNARFRDFRVWKLEGTANYKWMFSAVPMDKGQGKLSKNDIKFATTVAGETCLRQATGMQWFPNMSAGE